MKHILILMLLVSTVVLAEEPPAFLKDASIVVTLKDGKQYTFSTDQWKVVPRLDKEAVICEQGTPVITEVESANRIRFMGGFGPQGDISITSSATEISVSTDTGPVFGLGYDRKISKKFSLGGQVISNGTYTLGLGVDF